MTPAEADALAKRIINTWRGGPPLREWTDTLEPLDPGRAGTTYIRLRSTEESAPSIAKFHAIYKTLHTDRPQPHNCPNCDDGWQTVEYESNGRTYRGCVPCGCPRGQANERTWNHARNAQRTETT